MRWRIITGSEMSLAELLSVERIFSRVEDIRDAADDSEKAHAMEDDLHQQVLTVIAAGAPNADKLAAEALKTVAIKFPRCCA